MPPFEVRFGKARTRRQRQLEQRSRRHCVAHRHQGHAEIVVEVGVAGRMGKRFAQQLDARLEVAGLAGDHTERADGGGMTGIAAQNLAIKVFRLAQLTGRVQALRVVEQLLCAERRGLRRLTHGRLPGGGSATRHWRPDSERVTFVQHRSIAIFGFDVQPVDQDEMGRRTRHMVAVDDLVHRGVGRDVDFDDIADRVTGQILRQRRKQFKCDLHALLSSCRTPPYARSRHANCSAPRDATSARRH